MFPTTTNLITKILQHNVLAAYHLQHINDALVTSQHTGSDGILNLLLLLLL